MEVMNGSTCIICEVHVLFVKYMHAFFMDMSLFLEQFFGIHKVSYNIIIFYEIQRCLVKILLPSTRQIQLRKWLALWICLHWHILAICLVLCRLPTWHNTDNFTRSSLSWLWFSEWAVVFTLSSLQMSTLVEQWIQNQVKLQKKEV